jgi:hypothetical protein
MNPLAAAAFGIVLAASAGLRAFLPVFSASLAIRIFDIPLPEHLGWMGATETLLLFGVATVLEILGDKIPFVDHLLDSVQTVVKPAMAVLAATPFLHDLTPGYGLALGIIMGAPLALGVHSAKVSARLGSSALTAGTANPFLSLIEDVVEIAIIAVTFVAPFVALALVAICVAWLVRLAARRRSRRTAATRPSGMSP